MPTPTLAPALSRTPTPTDSRTATSTATPIPPNLLRINIGTYPDIIDPQKSSFPNEIATLHMIYEGLTRLDNDLNTVPGAADRWEYGADGTVLTFHIRDGLTYSDGTPLNAKRFEYSLLRNIDPEIAGEYAYVTDDIVGAAEWRGADTTADGYDAAQYIAAVGIKALDADGRPCATGADGYVQIDCRTLRITLRRPAAYFHTVMSMWVTYPAKEENIIAGGKQWWDQSQYQIGNGPLVLAAVKPYVRQYFIPNPRYWRGLATYDLEYGYITDSGRSLTAYQEDKFDIVGYSADDLPRINADPQLRAEALLYPGRCTYGLMFNVAREPFTDNKVREAFALAIDREAWVRDVLSGTGAPALTWIPPGFPGHDPTERRYAFDPEKARAALAMSSYGGPVGLPAVDWISYSQRTQIRAEWFKAKFTDVLGVTIWARSFDPEGWVTPTPQERSAAFVVGWCADYPDPQDWLSIYWRTGAFSERFSYYSSPALDALLDQADSTVKMPTRLALYAQAEDLLLADLPMVPLWNSVNTCLVKPAVQGLVTTPMDSVGDYSPGSGWCGSNDPLTIRIER